MRFYPLISVLVLLASLHLVVADHVVVSPAADSGELITLTEPIERETVLKEQKAVFAVPEVSTTTATQATGLFGLTDSGPYLLIAAALIIIIAGYAHMTSTEKM